MQSWPKASPRNVNVDEIPFFCDVELVLRVEELLAMTACTHEWQEPAYLNGKMVVDGRARHTRLWHDGTQWRTNKPDPFGNDGQEVAWGDLQEAIQRDYLIVSRPCRGYHG